jgi:tetratricopeptide (TPR) repeat protein
MPKTLTLALASLLLACSAPIAQGVALPQSSAPLQVAINNREDPAQAAYNLGVTKYEANDLPAALAAFNESIRLNPNVAVSYANRGNVKDDMGDRQGALADYEKALSLDSTNHTIYYNRGLTYSRMEKYPEAIADFKKAVELEPSYAPAHRGLGVSKYLSSSSRQLRLEGIADVQKAIDLYRAQGDETAANKVQKVLEQMKQYIDS